MVKAFAIRWNVVGFAGGGAFVLSFLLGMVSGNPFLTILFRAVLFGGLFAFLGGGAAFLLDRFIPQLIGSDEGTPDSEPNVKRASNIDIVLDDESPFKDEAIEELSLDEVGPAKNRGGENEDDAPAARAASYPAAEDESADSFESEAAAPVAIEEDFASEPAGADGKMASPRSPTDVGGEDQNEDERPAVSARPGEQADKLAPAGNGKRASGREKRLEDDDLDVLPDMSGFESSFSPVTSEGVVTDTDSFESFGTDSLKKGDVDKDPETLVKAVRTIIKRDEGKNS